MWGLILSMATVAWSTLVPSNRKNNNDASHSEDGGTRFAAAMIHMGSETKIFLSGIALTLGTQLLYQWLSRNPHYQRLKFMLFSLLGGVFKKGEAPLRKPTSILDLRKDSPLLWERESIVRTEYGSIVKLVTPDRNMTTSSSSSFGSHVSSAMHISLITIEPKGECPSQQSPPFLEFYHVVSGSGFVSQQGIVDTMEIQTGDVFVVDPLTVRWISNKQTSGSSNSTKPLLLLRVTEGGVMYSLPKWNQIRLDPNVSYKNNGILLASSTTANATYQAIAHGLQKVHKVAIDYVSAPTNGKNGSNSSNGSRSSDTPKQDNTSSTTTTPQLHNGR